MHPSTAGRQLTAGRPPPGSFVELLLPRPSAADGVEADVVFALTGQMWSTHLDGGRRAQPDGGRDPAAGQ